MTAQWSDDLHHALHAALTGETQGYYVDFGALDVLARTLTQVFRHDGDFSAFRGKDWGRPVDPARHRGHRFLGYLQDHDQVGNRAVGDRISARSAARPAGGRRGAVLTSPVHADGLHGRGVGGLDAVAVLHRLPRPGARRGGPQRPPVGVRRARLGRRGRARPAGPGHPRSERPRLGRARQGRHAACSAGTGTWSRCGATEPDLQDDDLRHVHVDTGAGPPGGAPRRPSACS